MMDRQGRVRPAGSSGGARATGLAVAALAALLAASPAPAASLGPHQDAADQNPCRKCHNTAAGIPMLRGWAGAGAGPATGWGAKPISALCYLCHSASGGPLLAPGKNMLANAYADGSHGYAVAAVPDEPEGSPQGSGVHQSVAASGLPYATLAEIECTSCHFVHNAASRPFNQRADLQTLCEECHEGRAANDAANRSALGQTRTYSLHPTRRGLGDTARANLKDAATIHAGLRVVNAPAWALGGHLDGPTGDAGALDCQTCHAVHGPVQGTPGLPDLLAVDNATGAAGSALCEGCHFGGAAGEQVGSVAAFVQSALPAGSWSDHPIDAVANRPFYPTGVALPANWLAAGTPNGDRGAEAFHASGAPTCSSCHDTHGGIADTPLLRGPAPTGGFGALEYDDWCFACHGAAVVVPTGHHSTRANLSASLGDAVTSQLDCGDCHGPAASLDWTAHNGFWTFAVPVSATDSALCEGCHDPDNPTDLVSPGPKGRAFTEPADFPATHGTPRGGASHYLGPDSDEFAGVSVRLDSWSSGFFSSYGQPNTGGGGEVAPALAGEVICESCHDALFNDGRANPGGYSSPRAAGWESNLLLEPYTDDPAGAGSGTGAYAVGSALCRGCHGAIGTHHPQTGDAVSLSGTLLRTGGASFADQTAAPVGGGAAPGTLSYPASNALDCDSCHRPHRADDDSDVTAAAHGAGTSADGRATRHILEVDGTSHLYSDLCLECHAR